MTMKGPVAAGPLLPQSPTRSTPLSLAGLKSVDPQWRQGLGGTLLLMAASRRLVTNSRCRNDSSALIIAVRSSWVVSIRDERLRSRHPRAPLTHPFRVDRHVPLILFS